MSAGLFREEVLLAQRGEWIGSIRLQVPRLGWAFFGISVMAVAAILGLLLGGHYTRHEQVAGTLVPSSGLLIITPIVPGIVTRLQVREGDLVHAGQPLVEISGAQVSATLGDTDAAIAAQLQIKRNHLQADLDDQQRLSDLQKRDLRSRLTLLHGQMAQMEQQVALQQQRADSANALYDQWEKASKTGVVSKLQILQQHDTALQNLVQLKELKGQTFQLQQQAEQLQGQLDQLPLTVSSKRKDAEGQLADVAQSLAQNAAHRSVLLRAPADGTVTNVLVHPGQTVTAQQSLLTVLPAHARLLAELWVPSKAVGFIDTGDPVVMRYQAYPYQKFGQHVGRVREVSRSTVPATEVSRLLGQDIKDPRYRVEVDLDSQSVMAYGKRESLRPGMTLNADVLLDRRRLIEWVLEPLYGFSHELRTDVTVPNARIR